MRRSRRKNVTETLCFRTSGRTVNSAIPTEYGEAGFLPKFVVIFSIDIKGTHTTQLNRSRARRPGIDCSIQSKTRYLATKQYFSS
ncbi:hypothetical protein GWI33_019632 [Rhynchophorus ferrugineus]|uniref:Uncharacterized protein n=1 Tax=Rhynchophorus ferrugineus TaxID=354439 RepID=A0A834HRA1_RHYFE|nr:hypothetical protein GWI33_019632 [Rhynchophorus ferrugineus]